MSEKPTPLEKRIEEVLLRFSDRDGVDFFGVIQGITNLFKEEIERLAGEVEAKRGDHLGIFYNQALGEAAQIIRSSFTNL